MKMTGFWRHFEESVCGCTEERISMLSGRVDPTHTRQREEPDQRRTSGLLGGTLTKTATREETDQDVSTRQYRAIPPTGASGTKTLTEQREELDQDESTQVYSALRNCRALS